MDRQALGWHGRWNGRERAHELSSKPRSSVTPSLVVDVCWMLQLEAVLQPSSALHLRPSSRRRGPGAGPLVWHAPVGLSGHRQMGLVS